MILHRTFEDPEQHSVFSFTQTIGIVTPLFVLVCVGLPNYQAVVLPSSLIVFSLFFNTSLFSLVTGTRSWVTKVEYVDGLGDVEVTVPRKQFFHFQGSGDLAFTRILPSKC